MKLLTFFFVIFSVIINLNADGVQPIGSGLYTDPYQVDVLDNLLWISTNDTSWDAHFIQISDIDASETVNWNNGEGFSPIGSEDSLSVPFTGNYNGQTYSISNLFIDRLNNHTGLFGYVYDGTIRNIDIQNANITGFLYVGILAGKIQDSDLSNINISGIVDGSYTVGSLAGVSVSCEIDDCSCSVTVFGGSYTGGLIGRNSYSELYNSFFIGNVTGIVSTGGFIGENSYSDIDYCYCVGNVEGASPVGGFIADNFQGDISKSYSIGNVDGFNLTGGFIGVNQGESILQQCCSAGDVTGQGGVGGFIGNSTGSSSYDHTIENCYSIGNVEGDHFVGGFVGSTHFSNIYNCFSNCFVNDANYLGGFAAFSTYAIIENSFWDIETSGQTISDGGTGKTTAEMQDVATYTLLSTIGLDDPWDFVGNPFNDTGYEDYWDINPEINDGYPFLTALQLVGIQEEEIPHISPMNYNLSNYPNPFNPSTTIEFSIQNDSSIELSFFNIKGQKIKTLTKNDFTKGQHLIPWKGVDDFNKSVSSGIYYYKLKVNDKTEVVKKCLLLK